MRVRNNSFIFKTRGWGVSMMALGSRRIDGDA
jgi:hypothetical protein